MKLKKSIILLLMMFLVTGCASVDYELNIDKDLMVTENVNISATKEYFDSFYMNFPITIVTENYNSEWINPLKENNYSTEIKKNNIPYPSVFASKKYSDLKEYSSNMVFKNQVFTDINVLEKDNLITLKTIDFLPYTEDETDTRFPISKLKVDIKVPFVVTNNNADSINRRTNTYTWNINKETDEKEINITFDKTRTYVYNLSWYISLGIIIIIVIVAVILIIRAVRKNKLNNGV